MPKPSGDMMGNKTFVGGISGIKATPPPEIQTSSLAQKKGGFKPITTQQYLKLEVKQSYSQRKN